MSSGTAVDLRSVLRTRHCAGLLVGSFLFIVYGSLVPFQFQYLPLEHAVESYHQTIAKWSQVHSRSDFVANVMLYIPFVFLLLATPCTDRRRFWSLLCAPVAILLGAVTSLGIEFIQLYFPPRTTSFSDLLANTLGGAIGAVLWLCCGQRVVHWCRLVWTAQLGFGLAGLVLPAYLLLVFVLSQLPPELTISPVEVYHKYQRGMVRLIPFAVIPNVDPFDQAEKHLWNVAYFYPIGLLLAFRNPSGWRARKQWPYVFGIGLLIAGTIECLQLFNLGRYFDTSDIFSGGVSILLGWVSGIALVARWTASGCQPIPAPRGRRGVPWLVVLGVVWLTVVLFVEWHPFRVVTTPRWPTTWLPFLDYYQQRNYFQPLDQLVRKTLLFLPGGILLALSLQGSGRRGRGWGIVGLAFLIASVAEAGQLFLPERYFSLTDILVETNGAWLGRGLANHGRLMMPPQRADQCTALPAGASNAQGTVPIDGRD